MARLRVFVATHFYNSCTYFTSTELRSANLDLAVRYPFTRVVALATDRTQFRCRLKKKKNRPNVGDQSIIQLYRANISM